MYRDHPAWWVYTLNEIDWLIEAVVLGVVVVVVVVCDNYVEVLC